MTPTFTKRGLAIAGVIALAATIPGTAYATHIFDDVADDAFYADPVEWAADNLITLGITDDLFGPDDVVTRGQAVTFLKRYHDNVATGAIEDAVDDAVADVDAETLDGRNGHEIARVAGTRNEAAVNNWDGTAQVTERSITAPTNGYLLLSYVVTLVGDINETAAGPGTISAGLDVDGGEVADTNNGVDFSLHYRANSRTVNITTVVAVAAGEHDIEGRIQASLPAGGLLYIYDQTVTAVFVPFDANGLVPV